MNPKKIVAKILSLFKESRSPMANISDAEGTIVFTTDTRAALDALIDVFHIAEEFGYHTTFDPESVEVHPTDDGRISGTVSFYGFGRWSYHNNAEHMIDWICDDINDIPRQTLDLVNASAFDVTFTWREYEIGYCFVARGCVEYHKDANVPFSATKTMVTQAESGALSVPAMRDYGFDSSQYIDFTREGIENFLTYFSQEKPDKIGDLGKYTLDQLANAMKYHETDVFYDVNFMSAYDKDIDDYRERILDRLGR